MAIKNYITLLLTITVAGLICVQPVIADENTETTSATASPKTGWGEFSVVERRGPRSKAGKVLMWFPNRIVDFLDIFKLDVGLGFSRGGVVRVSKYAQAGYRSISPGSLRVGLMGRKPPVMVEHSSEFGFGPGYVSSDDREVCAGEVGLGLDLFITGAYAGICVDEAVDFIGGIFTWDPKNDDF